MEDVKISLTIGIGLLQESSSVPTPTESDRARGNVGDTIEVFRTVGKALLEGLHKFSE